MSSLCQGITFVILPLQVSVTIVTGARCMILPIPIASPQRGRAYWVVTLELLASTTQIARQTNALI